MCERGFRPLRRAGVSLRARSDRRFVGGSRKTFEKVLSKLLYIGFALIVCLAVSVFCIDAKTPPVVTGGGYSAVLFYDQIISSSSAEGRVGKFLQMLS